MEHIVSRADLAGTESSPSASPEPEILKKFKGQFDFVASKTDAGDDAELGVDGYDDGLEFQLFAAPKAGGDTKSTAAGDTHKIRLHSPSIDPDRIGFVRPERNQSYYFTRPATEEEKQELEIAALTGDQVLSHSKSPRPGSECAWKVLHLPPTGLSKDLQTAECAAFAALTGNEQRKKRTRPGKKYRIKLRKKSAAKQAQKDAKKMADEAKEVEEREKRTRRNREKKVKRKAKEKAKKDEIDGGDVVEDFEIAQPEPRVP